MASQTDGDAARIEALKERSEADPGSVDPAELRGYLEDPNPTVHRPAMQAMTVFADYDVDPVASALPQVLRHLETADGGTITSGLTLVATVARLDPAAVAPHIDAIGPYLDPGTDTDAARLAARTVAEVAAEHPSTVLDLVPRLAMALETEDLPTRRKAVGCLSLIAERHPHELRPAYISLVDQLDSDDPALLHATLVALGRMVAAFPTDPLTLLERTMPLVRHETTSVRINATGVIGDLLRYCIVLDDRFVTPLLASLEDRDGLVRSNAMTAVARIAITRPKLIREYTATIERSLGDDDPGVRERACFALGAATATGAEPRLAAVAKEDPKSEVSDRATWALDRITS